MTKPKPIPGAPGRKPAIEWSDRVRLVALDQISVGERHRQIDPATAASLWASIAVNGLIQPIGLREVDEGNFDLIYGAHRLAAFRTGLEDAGKNDRARWSRIEAVIHPRDTSDEDAEMLEIAENVDRKDLSPIERHGQRMRYAELLQAKGEVLSRDKKISLSKQIKSLHAEGTSGRDAVYSGRPTETTTEKVAKLFGISDRALRDSAKMLEDQGNAAAEYLGVSNRFEFTPERAGGAGVALALIRQARETRQQAAVASPPEPPKPKRPKKTEEEKRDKLATDFIDVWLELGPELRERVLEALWAELLAVSIKLMQAAGRDDQIVLEGAGAERFDDLSSSWGALSKEAQRKFVIRHGVELVMRMHGAE
jgi:ParB-like chromosome segregation protein Spo0J